MARTPYAILREIAPSKRNLPVEYVLLTFVKQGYGLKKAKKWIREYQELGWIKTTDNPDIITVSLV